MLLPSSGFCSGISASSRTAWPGETTTAMSCVAEPVVNRKFHSPACPPVTTQYPSPFEDGETTPWGSSNSNVMSDAKATFP